MRCPYCEKSVIGEKTVVVVPGLGPAHRDCHKWTVLSARNVAGMDLAELSLWQLNELRDMILMELNSRQQNQALDNIELF